jgi:hypothetical protein
VEGVEAATGVWLVNPKRQDEEGGNNNKNN